MFNKKKISSVVAGLFITVPAIGPFAYAQDEIKFDEPTILLETLVVTATRRQEVQSEVPVSITAISAAGLEDLGVESILDFESNIPNLNVKTAFGGDSAAAVEIRGLVQASSDSTLDTAVGVYQDEVFLARNFSVLGQLLDVERVEVLRGPQGTLFGRNTIGGAIQVVSKKPELGEDAAGYLKLGAGNFGLAEISGASTVQLADSFAMRFAGSVSQRDGYTRSLLVDDTFNPAAGRFGYIDGVSPVLDEIDTDNRDNTAFRVSALWQPSDQTSLDLSYYRSENDTNGILQRNRLGDLGSPDFAVGDIRTAGRGFSVLTQDDFYSALTPLRPNGDDEVSVAVATLAHEFSDTLRMKLIASFADIEVDELSNTDGLVQSLVGAVPSPAFLLLRSERDQEADQTTFEFQLSGESESGVVEWIAGLYYFEEESRDRRQEFLRSPILEVTPPELLPPSVRVLAGGITNNQVDVLASNDSASVYGSVNWSVNELFTLRFGGRYTEDTKGYLGQSARFGGPIPDGVQLCIFTNRPTSVEACELPVSADFENFTWDISADYKFNPATFGYAKVGTGYRTGGISLNANSRETAEPFNEDEVISYELGLKTQLGASARLNASVFYVDYTDVQQNVLSTDANSCQPEDQNGGTGVIITCNLGDAESAGFELDGVWQISDSFGLSANVGYTDFKFDDSASVRLLSPEMTYSMSGIFTSNIASMPLRAVLTYSKSDDFFSSGDSSVPANIRTVDGYSLLNARVSLQVTERLNLSMWGRNLTEDEYLRFSTGTTNAFAIFTSGLPGAPRTFGVDVNYQF